MDVRMKMPESAFAALRQQVFAQAPKEAGCFGLAGITRLQDEAVILLRRAVPVPAEDFVIQEQYRLEVAGGAINGLASLCSANAMLPLVAHSHPAEIPYSYTDDYGERRIAATFENLVESEIVLVSLLFCPGSVRGRVWLRGKDEPVPFYRIDVLGPTIKTVYDDRKLDPSGYTVHVDRQVLAFGELGQRRVASVKVAIVGLGGTGSAVCEQLARLGVEDFVLVDHDCLDESNVSRVYGSVPADVDEKGRGLPKVEIAKRNVMQINREASVNAVAAGIHEAAADGVILDRDVVFLCTDEHRGRAIANDLAYQHLIPTINLGVSVRSRDHSITHAGGAVDVLSPDRPCLWCAQFLDARRIHAESLSHEERQARAGEGYVQDLNAPAPMVVSFTSRVASDAVTEFLRMVVHFGDPTEAPERLRWDILDGSTRRCCSRVEPKCRCRQLLGRGDLS